MPDEKPPAPPPDPPPLDELERQFHAGEVIPLRKRDEGTGAHEEHEDLDDEEALKGTILAQRLARRRGYGVAAREKRPPQRFLHTFTLVSLALISGWALAGKVPALQYWLSSAPPIDIGRLGAYHPDKAPGGAYVKVEGIAQPGRLSFSSALREHELFVLLGSRILVDRLGAPDESLKGYGFRYQGEGRLQRLSQAPEYEGVRKQLAEKGEIAREGEVWILEDGAVPRRGFRTPLEAGFWALLCGVCASVAVRRLLRKKPEPAA